MSSTGASTAAYAVADDAYLYDYTTQDNNMLTENGNLTTADLDMCGFKWRAQAVIDADLPNHSQNGFIESVWPTGSGSGDGYLSLQHWVNGLDSGHIVDDQLNWRIPIAVDNGVSDAQVTIVFDDPDWTPNPGSLYQYSEWSQQPGFESAFHRFTGVTGYVPHDDSQVGAFAWGHDDTGHQTLSFSLGHLQPGSSTVIGFTGTARSTQGTTGVDNITAGTAYGAKLTLNGTRPLAECYRAGYPEVTVQAGIPVEISPIISDGSGAPVAMPPGTIFQLAPTAPADATIDPVTGVIRWSMPISQSPVQMSIPVVIVLPDDGNFLNGSRIATTALISASALAVTNSSGSSSSPQGHIDTQIPGGVPDAATVRSAQSSEDHSKPALGASSVAAENSVLRTAETHQGEALAPRITLETTSPLVPHLLLILGGGLVLSGTCALISRLRRKPVIASASRRSGGLAGSTLSSR